jgi:hypothetical protein
MNSFTAHGFDVGHAAVRRVRLVTAACLVLAACSKRDASLATSHDSSASPGTATAAQGRASASTSPGTTAVRGRLTGVTDTMLTVATANGDVRVVLDQPLQKYARESADLSRVTDHAFVGVTSVRQSDGSERATEIHVFPEELRGTNEGSFLMEQSSAGGVASTMTNGTVAAPRMTNGTVGGRAGEALTVEYRGGSQTIVVPVGVTVTAIAPTTAPLRAGANVVVLASKQSDGTLRASRLLLATADRTAK